MIPELEKTKKELENVLRELSDPDIVSNWEKFESLNKKRGFLEKLVERLEELEETKKKIQENKEIIKTETDPELQTLAENENIFLLEKKEKLEKEIENLLSEEKRSEESSDVILEIRAGAGGEEAALFAADLFRMYSKYAQNKNWEIKVLDSHPTELGGYKEIIFEITPGKSKEKNIWEKLKYEGGVHRVQRIPVTEKSGRIHTSTVSVVVLKKPKKGKIKINPADLKIETTKASGPGGQYVNKRMTAVRITHLPTGIVVLSQTERNLQQNKENALSILEAKLLEMEERKVQESVQKNRKSQIGRSERAEKIRTYNFPQNRVTDHRIKKTFHNLEDILDGNLDELIKSLQENLKEN